MKFNKIGITGATGVLGQIILKRFKELGIHYSLFEGDVRFLNDFKIWFENNKFVGIIHLAAIVSTSVVKNNFDMAIDINVNGTKNLIDALNLSKQTPWLFYSSTSHVYESKNIPILETDIIKPISEYGKTKYLAENIIIENYENYCIGRIFSFYHKTQKKPFLYPTMIERIKNENLEKLFELYGANSVRDFLNAEEVVNIILKLMNFRANGIYNIGSGKGTKIKDFVQNLTEKKLNIGGVGISDYLVANISKLNKLLSTRL
jgi:nucleoside-diphosphate-sugar epimerase